MQKFKLITLGGIRIVNKKELKEFLQKHGYYLTRSYISGELYSGNILIFKFNLIE